MPLGHLWEANSVFPQLEEIKFECCFINGNFECNLTLTT